MPVRNSLFRLSTENLFVFVYMYSHVIIIIIGEHVCVCRLLTMAQPRGVNQEEESEAEEGEGKQKKKNHSAVSLTQSGKRKGSRRRRAALQRVWLNPVANQGLSGLPVFSNEDHRFAPTITTYPTSPPFHPAVPKESSPV